jgi:hypothetical protein
LNFAGFIFWPPRRENPLEDGKIEPKPETPEAKAARLTARLRGLLREELAEYGGGEAFLCWVRSEGGDPPPSILFPKHV